MLERIIKMCNYRGLTKDGKWVYGWRCIWQGIVYIFDSPFNLFYSGQNEVISETVGQFTGLKDKNNKKVYKGDLLGSRFFSTILVVDQIIEGSNCGQWIARQKDGGYQDLHEALTADGYKIIGNIYTKPELMGNKNE